MFKCIYEYKTQNPPFSVHYITDSAYLFS